MRFSLQLLAGAIAFGGAQAMPASTLLGRDGLTLPSKDPFYFPEHSILSSYKPGEVIQHRNPPASIAAFGIAPIVNLKSAHQLLYRTEDNHGNATATVTTVLIPEKADLGKVLSYQIAVDAPSIDCSPSYALQQGAFEGPLSGVGLIVSQAEFILVQSALREGWVVAIPDFLGPTSAYLANRLSGQATLDGIRATLGSGDVTGVKSDARVMMWGYSGGALASGWAAELQQSYAPELKIAGAAVGGTVPNISNVISALNKQPLAGLIPAGVQGLLSQYPEAKALVDENLRDEDRDRFHQAQAQCLPGNVLGYMFNDILGMFQDRDFLLHNEEMRRIVAENSMGRGQTPTIPLFWYKSAVDEVSPVEDSDKLVEQYCRDGASIEYVRDQTSQHGVYAVTGAAQALAWLKKIMNGGEAQKGCSTKTQTSSLLDMATFEVLPKLIIDLLLNLVSKNWILV